MKMMKKFFEKRRKNEVENDRTVGLFKLKAQVADLECKVRQRDRVIARQKKLIEFSQSESESRQKTIKLGDEQQEISRLRECFNQNYAKLVAEYELLLGEIERENQPKENGENGQNRA